mmetsp:Transcript_6956/g.17030  ORF Transcript_6956/g.17030 Transcript_6956/m.17030 type:complete len:305 (-) Transcript_6956:231-1145(-)|eukprot:CAMPEP_0197174530 /NCGR_PEP_ID=MMETSP1423-20130617/1009_1 /TAXON_ID=476441 /ORGANISM="Pseudo-nitzschia heimii, Strain UNC1101" /LENGTH=304 /DNA_ID=CAMNT_0042623471 /DNA_START=90 /DNA_END=1004 /DNA_ORIENTATION=-
MKAGIFARLLVVAALGGASNAFAPQRPTSKASSGAISGPTPRSSSPPSLNVFNPFQKQEEAVPEVSAVVEEPEPGPLEAQNFVAMAVWASLVVWSLNFAPGSAGSIADNELLNTLISQPFPRPEGINELWFTIWNCFIIVPANIAFLASTTGRGQRLPSAPFLLASFGLGFFALGPYFMTRTVRTEPQIKEDLGFFGRNVFENRIAGAGLALVALSIPFSSGFVGCDVPAAVSGYQELISGSRFVAVSTVDLLIMSVLSSILVAEDASRRGLEDKSLPIALATLLVPVVGPSAWLVARPSLEEQ